MLNKTPLYMQVYEVLANRVVSGQWPKNTAIPNEYALSNELKVSIGTLRKAVDLLVQGRLVDRRQGKGTFVVDRMSDEVRRAYDPIRNADGSPISWRFLSCETMIQESTREEQEILKLAPRDLVARIRRISAIGSRPVVLADVLLPAARFPNIKELLSEDTAIVPLAARARIQLGSADEFADVHPATPDGAKALNIKPETPILRLRRLVHDAKGAPIEWRVAQCHLQGEQYHVEVVPAARDL